MKLFWCWWDGCEMYWNNQRGQLIFQNSVRSMEYWLGSDILHGDDLLFTWQDISEAELIMSTFFPKATLEGSSLTTPGQQKVCTVWDFCSFYSLRLVVLSLTLNKLEETFFTVTLFIQGPFFSNSWAKLLKHFYCKLSMGKMKETF